MIQVQDLNFTYEAGQAPVLKDLNLQIDEGEYIALIGPNGCGKTTLIRHFNGLLLATSGEVLVKGSNTRGKSLRVIRSLVGMVFQNPDHQIIGMSVEEDVAFGPGNLGLPPLEVRRRVDQALATVGLTDLAQRAPHTLSGGQKQLLALAGLLAMDPQIIVLDEPTSSLDPAGKGIILALLQKLNNQGIGVIHVTQNMEEAALADRVLVMDQGRLIADGSPRDILSRVDWLQALGLAPPRVTELMWQLQQAGEDVDSGIFKVEEACKEIIALLAQRRGSKLDYAPEGGGTCII